jgi:hypothetical protein
MTIEMVDTNGISPRGAAVNSQACKRLDAGVCRAPGILIGMSGTTRNPGVYTPGY